MQQKGADESLVPTELINLDKRNGWVGLVNVCGMHPEADIVVNTGSRNNESVRMFGSTLDQALNAVKSERVPRPSSSVLTSARPCPPRHAACLGPESASTSRSA